jgi:uncharacterized protein YceK
MRRTAVLALLAQLPASLGCGTVANRFTGRDMIYGGVVGDATVVAKGSQRIAGRVVGSAPLDCSPSAAEDSCGIILGLVDLPFSFVADTLTLPWTVVGTLHKLAAAEPEEKPVSAGRDQR